MIRSAKHLRRRQRVAAAKRALRRTFMNMKKRPAPDTSPLALAINRMNNWSRNQWARHCGKDPKKRASVEIAEMFARKPREAA